MESTKKQDRHRHSEETKAKIAKSNTGKVFSEERCRNIGKARELVLPKEQIVQLHELWSKRYVPARWIMEKLDLSERVYFRFLKEYCQVEQIKFLPQAFAPAVFEAIISMCRERQPYKDIAKTLELETRQVKHVIEKLAPFYGIKALPRFRPEKSEGHKKKLTEWLTTYNKQNPKKKENNPNWKGGITSVTEAIRKSDRYKNWRVNVLRRDGFKCIACGTKRDLQVDHIYPLVLILQDASVTLAEQAESCTSLWNIANGRTLCESCHRKTETYGKQRKKYRNEHK